LRVAGKRGRILKNRGKKTKQKFFTSQLATRNSQPFPPGSKKLAVDLGTMKSPIKFIASLYGALRAPMNSMGWLPVHPWLRSGLVIFQFTVSIILFIGTFVVYNQLDFIRNKRLGGNKITVPLFSLVFKIFLAENFYR
jgi:hypothetical protein